MLNVPRKVACEADAEKILEESYHVRRPLGVPTLIFDPADYAPEILLSGTSRFGNVRDAVSVRLQEFLMTDLAMSSPESEAHLAGKEGLDQTRSIVNKINAALSGNRLVAHALPHVAEPYYNVIICPRVTDVSTRIMTNSLGMKEEFVSDLPGTDAEWNFIKLWHEFGHGFFGGHEGKADKVSAYAYLYAHQKKDPIIALSDIRAAQAVIWHNKPRFLGKYGWPLVSILDQATDDPPPQSWDQVLKAVKGADPVSDDYAEDTRAVGFCLQALAERAFQNRDFEILTHTAEAITDRGLLLNERQVILAQRFAIAARRLSAGIPAYRAARPFPGLRTPF